MDTQAKLDQALCSAAEKGDTIQVINLLKKGANIEGGNVDPHAIFHTPLMLACKNGHLDTVVALAQHGANLESELYLTGRTPLSFALDNKHMPIVKFLLHSGVSTNHADLISGQQPITLDYANQTNFQEIFYLILSAMPFDEVIKASNFAEDENLILIKKEIEKNKQTLTKMLYHKQGNLNIKLNTDIINYMTRLLATQLSVQSFSKEYVLYCLKTDMQSILKQYFHEQKNQHSNALSFQDNDITFEQENSDITSTEPGQKSYTNMIYEGFTSVTNGFFNLFSNKRKREEDVVEEQQVNSKNPNKKRRIEK